MSLSPSISHPPHPTSQILRGYVLTSCGPRPSRPLVPLGPLRARLVAPRPSSLVAPRPSSLAPPLGPGSAHRPSRPPSGPPRRSSASVPLGPSRPPPGRVALFRFSVCSRVEAASQAFRGSTQRSQRPPRKNHRTLAKSREPNSTTALVLFSPRNIAPSTLPDTSSDSRMSGPSSNCSAALPLALGVSTSSV